ncbi:unnamed protein product [Cylicocyclus nassatus]|uniref:Uncharacterized protein n=1 Tax=Cylicocyclus nassatus TaxID=53992 RepID=A0AA36GRC3_CYLNA|nr:unnamed protein product [Cylicocyclus nassatus]
MKIYRRNAAHLSKARSACLSYEKAQTNARQRSSLRSDNRNGEFNSRGEFISVLSFLAFSHD